MHGLHVLYCMVNPYSKISNGSALDSLVQDIIAQLPAIFALRYSALSAAALYLYDYFLTFPLELRHIWRGKMNVMRILFIVNRYSCLSFVFGQILLFLVNKETNSEYSVFYYITEISSLLTVIATASIFTLRTYAIYGKSKTVLFFLAVPTLVNLTSGIWEVVAETSVALPSELQIGPLTCTFSGSFSYFVGPVSFFRYLSDRKVATLVNIVSVAVFDMLVIILTVYRAGRLALQSRNAGFSRSLSFILVRDGVLYYSVIFVMQFVLVAFFAIVLETGNLSLRDASSSVAYVNYSFQVILINRLVLNLSDAANTREDSEFRTRTGLEPLTFAADTVLGNIGGSLRTLPDDLDDELLGGDEWAKTDGTRDNPIESVEMGRLSDTNDTNSQSVIDITSV